MTPVDIVFYLGAFLFSSGLLIVFTKRNAIMVLIGIELILNAANLNLVAWNARNSTTLDGQMFALFVVIVAVCEASVGVAIIVRMYRYFQTSVPDQASDLKEKF